MSAAGWPAIRAGVKVGVDGRSLRAAAGRRGVARYLGSLLPTLAAGGPDDRYAVLVPGRPGREVARVATGPNIIMRSTLVDSRPLFAAAALIRRPRVDRILGGCDVVWAPTIAPLAISTDVPLVVTVVSGPGREPSVGDGRASLVPPGYVLAVGALEPRKRPDLLVEAHARARQAGLRAELVFAGDGSLRRPLADSGATVLGYVPDDQLEVLYRDALALTCVSREEGFAFTPLEAVALGTPAVVSDLPVFAETLGDGALRVAPGNPDALADALLRVERDRTLRARLVEAGQAAAGRLSWSRAATETRRVLAEAAECRT